MATIPNLATGDWIDETWVDAVSDGLNTGVFSGTYSPTLTNLAVGSTGTNTAYYAYAGGILVINGIIQYGGTGITYGASPNLTLPSGFTAAAPTAPNYGTSGMVTYVCAGTTYHGYMALVSQTVMRPYVWNVNGTYIGTANLSATVPGAWNATSYFRYMVAIPGTMV